VASTQHMVQNIQEKMKLLAEACEGLDEATASRAPGDHWSPKQILSHLCGPEGNDPMALLRAFLEADTPTIDLDVGNPFFSEKRANTSFAALLEEVLRKFEALAAFTSGLTPEQLARKARIPALKDTPLGDSPTLEQMITGLTDFHMPFHIDQMRQVIQALQDESAARG